MIVNIKDVISSSVIIMPEIKVWTGMSKLSVSDFPPEVQKNLPPDYLAKLGSKQLLPKDYLREPGVIRSRTWNSLVRVGIHFLGGFLIPNVRIQEVEDFLHADKGDFESSVRKIINGLPKAIEEWLAQTPDGWKFAISSAIPTAGDIASRYSYDWYEYALDPATCNNGSASLGRVLSGAFTDEIAALARRQYEIIEPKSSVFGFRLKGMEALREKLAGYRITLPLVGPVIDALDDATNKARNNNEGINDLKSMLKIMSDPASLDTFLSSGGVMPVPPTQTAEPEPVQEPEPEPVQEPEPKPVPVVQEPEPEPKEDRRTELECLLTKLQEKIGKKEPEPEPEPEPVQESVQNKPIILGYDDDEEEF